MGDLLLSSDAAKASRSESSFDRQTSVRTRALVARAGGVEELAPSIRLTFIAASNAATRASDVRPWIIEPLKNAATADPSRTPGD
jgi:hypothetical protein